MSTLRPVAGTERVYLAASQVYPPFLNQIVLEGGGAISPSDLARALALADAPEARARWAGVGPWARWVDSGLPPRCRRVSGADWRGDSGENAPFLEDPLDPLRGASAEVLLVEGNPSRLIFRTAHATMDGMGTFLWMDEVFRALRGERGVAQPQRQTDAAYVGRAAIPPDHLDPRWSRVLIQETGGFCWARRALPPLRRPLARLLAVLAGEVARPAVFDIPVDLRAATGAPPGMGNLTGLLRLPVGDPHAEAVESALVEGVMRGGVGNFARAGAVHRFLPLALLRGLLRLAQRGGRSTTATVSNLGRAHPWEGGGFAMRRVFSVPPAAPGGHPWITLAGGPDGVDLVLRGRAPAAELAAHLDRWARAMEAMEGTSSEEAQHRL